MRSGDAYQLLTRYARILFPIAALGILASLFLLARDPNHDSNIAMSQSDAADKDYVNRLRLSGVSDTGSTIELNAQKAIPEDDGIVLEGVASVIETANSLIEISSKNGRSRTSPNRATLMNDVAIQTSEGHKIFSQRIDADIERGIYTSPGPIRGEMRFGTIDAGSMRFAPKDDGQDLVFREGVSLLYQNEAQQTAHQGE